MPNYLIDVTENAKYRINQLTDYILYEFKSPIAATNTLKGIYDKIYSLTSNPYYGTNYNSTNLKFVRYKNYLIYYEIDEINKTVIIKTIMHKRQRRSNIY